METYKNLKRGTKIELIVSLILIAIGCACLLSDLVYTLTTQKWLRLFHIATDIVMLSFILTYMVYEYKKPHGNMLKITFLIFSLYLVAWNLIPRPVEEIVESRAYLNLIADAGTGIATVLVAYIGGRLNRIERNKVLMIVTGAVLLASVIMDQFAFPDFSIQRTIGTCFRLFVWIALCTAYTARYEEHKAAGLADKQDAEN